MPVAFVIGGARRIGAAIVRGLASDGFDVGLTYRSSMQQAAELTSSVTDSGRRAGLYRCDVTNPTELTAAVDELTRELGPPDVIVYNVGVFPPATPVKELREDDLIDAIRINTIPLLTIARAYQRHCLASDHGGRIVVIGSLGAREIWRDRAAYNTSKAAQTTLALSLARSLAPTIRLNIVAPGAISQPHEAQESDASLVDPARIPMKRHGQATDVVDAVRYFARCSEYITGQTIVVDGGYGLVR
jgi:3-oxoacyl-[acyl-carrier protein] reductase